MLLKVNLGQGTENNTLINIYSNILDLSLQMYTKLLVD